MDLPILPTAVHHCTCSYWLHVRCWLVCVLYSVYRVIPVPPHHVIYIPKHHIFFWHIAHNVTNLSAVHSTKRTHFFSLFYKYPSTHIYIEWQRTHSVALLGSHDAVPFKEVSKCVTVEWMRGGGENNPFNSV